MSETRKIFRKYCDFFLKTRNYFSSLMRLMKDWKVKVTNLMDYWRIERKKDSLILISFCSNVRNLIVLRDWDCTSGINFMGFIAHMFELTSKCEEMKLGVCWISSLEKSFK